MFEMKINTRRLM